jgi:hypothetical protein
VGAGERGGDSSRTVFDADRGPQFDLRFILGTKILAYVEPIANAPAGWKLCACAIAQSVA